MSIQKDLDILLLELNCDIDNGILVLGLYIDELSDAKDIYSLRLVKDFLHHNILIVENTIHMPKYLYFFANVFSFLGEDEAAVLNYRKAIINKSFEDLECQTKAEIYVNLGNIMNQHGRYSEALECYGKALEVSPDFFMALGNMGICLKTLAFNLYDVNHQVHALRFAYYYLNKAIENNKTKGFLHEAADNAFILAKNTLEEIFEMNHISKEICDFKEFSLGKKSEKKYREWCLENILYLNPMNDLTKHTVSAHDIIHLPNMTFDIQDNSIYEYLAMFNQLKQEYVSARYLYYDSINNERTHFSDKDVTLINPLSYQEYSYNVEKCKIAFRIMYSILDKIGFFINKYFKLGIGERNTYFSSSVKKLLTTQNGNYNWSIDTLYWISKEVDEDSINPYSLKIKELRNFLEHKFFQLLTYGDYNCVKDGDILSMGRMEFQLITMNLIKIVRSSIVSLSLSIHRNESIKNSTTENKITMPIPHSGFIEDNWKI